MNTLILIRHAKSSWDFPLRDFDRPLTSSGITKAITLAKKTATYIPKDPIIWSSSAKRASTTATLFVENWNRNPAEIQFLDTLYTFDENKLSAVVKSCPNDYKNLILFGHNNAITDFVNKFGDIYIDNVPTAGLVSIIFETDSWKDITKGKTDKILFPRDC
ncbi:MAG: histidine phosphatase family protein [Bacteroidota bacterium]